MDKLLTWLFSLHSPFELARQAFFTTVASQAAPLLWALIKKGKSLKIEPKAVEYNLFSISL